MKKIKTQVDAFVFNDEEIYRIRELLLYCKHRIALHKKSGLSKNKWAKDFIEYLLEQFKQCPPS